eukprot:1195810-Prorocentrum_minimum.AAC.4
MPTTAQLGNEVIHKPFVEKPVCGEDHNVCIYYPHSVGGGMKQLFRKRNDRSSEFVTVYSLLPPVIGSRSGFILLSPTRLGPAPGTGPVRKRVFYEIDFPQGESRVYIGGTI